MPITADQARRRLRERERQAQARGRARAERLRARVPEAARILRELGARRVLVFGSVARDEARDDSDLDLAVEGLSASRYFEALAAIMSVVGGPVDLVRLEDAPASLRDRIAEEGRAA